MDISPTSQSDREQPSFYAETPHRPLLFYRLVFNNYTWDTGSLPYSHWKSNIIPSRIPLSALIAGMPDANGLTIG